MKQIRVAKLYVVKVKSGDMIEAYICQYKPLTGHFEEFITKTNIDVMGFDSFEITPMISYYNYKAEDKLPAVKVIEKCLEIHNQFKTEQIEASNQLIYR